MMILLKRTLWKANTCEKQLLNPFVHYHLISSKFTEGLFLQSCRNLISLSTFGMQSWQRPFENPNALCLLDPLCHQISGFRIHKSEMMSQILSFLLPSSMSISQVLTSMLLCPVSLRWTCQWTLETGWIENERWEREADFAAIPWKATSWDRVPCLSCVYCVFSDQKPPSRNIPMYWLQRCWNQEKTAGKYNSWGWNIKRMNKIKSRIRDK